MDLYTQALVNRGSSTTKWMKGGFTEALTNEQINVSKNIGVILILHHPIPTLHNPKQYYAEHRIFQADANIEPQSNYFIDGTFV